MYRVEAYFKGKLVTSEDCPPTIKTEEEAKTRIINTLYWNHIPCSMANSGAKWWNKFEYKITALKDLKIVQAIKELKDSAGLSNKNTLEGLIAKSIESINKQNNNLTN